MSYIEIILNNCLYLACPIALYLLYTSYKKNLVMDENSMAFEIAITSSLYFLIRYGLPLHKMCPTMLFDIPLLLCFYKRRTNYSLLVSITLIIYQFLRLKINIFLLIIEYIIYFLIYLFVKRGKFTPNKLINYFIIINAFFLAIKIFLYINPLGSYNENIKYIFCISFIIYLVANVVLYFLMEGEKIVNLNTNIYKIEKEKELRASLFKVTHEIKNPIAVVKGYLDMLDLDDKKKVDKYIPIIKDEITRTLILMDDFLDYTKIKIVKEEIDLVMLLEDIEASLISLFKNNGIVSSFDYSSEEIYLEADYNRLKQVFINLLKNALEAVDITKKEKYINISVKELNEKVIIKIRDNGIGMDTDVINRVGEMFFTTKSKGTGLGTTLSREIIELHNGIIKYNSVKNSYTEVIISLPK